MDSQDPSQSRFFFYDELDRLWKATDHAGNPLFTYTYDAVGNRSQEVGPAGTTTYTTEPGTDRLASASGAKARQYAHDAFGNRIWAGATPYAGTPSLRYNESNPWSKRTTRPPRPTSSASTPTTPSAAASRRSPAASPRSTSTTWRAT